MSKFFGSFLCLGRHGTFYARFPGSVAGVIVAFRQTGCLHSELVESCFLNYNVLWNVEDPMSRNASTKEILVSLSFVGWSISSRFSIVLQSSEVSQVIRRLHSIWLRFLWVMTQWLRFPVRDITIYPLRIIHLCSVHRERISSWRPQTHWINWYRDPIARRKVELRWCRLICYPEGRLDICVGLR